jgi:hypothetical protein
MQMLYILASYNTLSRVAKAIYDKFPDLFTLCSYDAETQAVLADMGIREYPAYWINAKVAVESLVSNEAYCSGLAEILADRALLDTTPSFFYCKKIHNPTSFAPDLYDATARTARLAALRSHIYSACGKKWVEAAPPAPVVETDPIGETQKRPNDANNTTEEPLVKTQRLNDGEEVVF